METTENLIEKSQEYFQAAATAFQKARFAFTEYRGLTVSQRIRELLKLKDYFLKNRAEIVEEVMKATGKCRTDALIAEIIGVVDYINWLGYRAEKILADQTVHTPITLLGKKSKIFHEPLGAVLIIAPWNYPVHTGITSLAAAFAAGNTVIYKPSEHTPMTGVYEKILSCSEILSKCVQIVYGDGNMGRALIDHKPAKIFFTGSTRTGRAIAKQAADYLIPTELELGGKDAMVVFADVPLDRPVAGAIWGALTHSGQSCSAVERLYVQDTVYEQFIVKLKSEMEKLIIAPGDDGSSDIGRMTVRFQMEKAREHVEDARAKGAEIIMGGFVQNEQGLIYAPTLVANTDPSMLLISEETFGPVIPVIRFTSESEVIEMANNCKYGLCASVFSADMDRAARVARALEVGGVSINNVNMSEGNPELPFGGMKETGTGRIRGAEGLLAFTRSKSVLIDKPNNKIEANWYPYTKKKLNLLNNFIDALYGGGPLSFLKSVYHGLSLEAFSQKPRK
jgi:acyl-CoA reductase-like NAD-dependent aldehyde dehydrogenase